MWGLQLYQIEMKKKSDKWRTPVEDIPPMGIVRPTDSIFSIGSCFSDNMAVLLSERKMQVTANPFGTIYNPVAIQSLMQRVADAAYFSPKDIFEYRGLYRSLEAHSTCSAISEEGTLSLLNAAVDRGRESLRSATLVIVTLGTSLVQVHREQNRIVANNHTLPATDFFQKQLTIAEAQMACEKIVQSIHRLNPNARLLFTLSPVRHVSGGLVANARSKAVLLEAMHQVVEKYDYCIYFPAYEYVIDELRDYRFYKDDMIHPSDRAVQYIWDRFISTVMASDTLELIRDMEVLLAARQHSLLHPGTEESRLFIARQLTQIASLQQKYPFLHFDEEAQYFHSLSSS